MPPTYRSFISLLFSAMVYSYFKILITNGNNISLRLDSTTLCGFTQLISLELTPQCKEIIYVYCAV